ncbi:glycolate oxidase subunit GlcF [Azoarcus indigens]|uniref:Glycolate oxidase iron-sulfur subunit n=1 Tax=Azoarcus indigens TaxID=29545 RepID=A0A4R6DIC7_9RHOO|nr:glycolate oxidase subunit GlcF [Azoarcus indigens]NMG67235.1 glycolate oxidase subunit GlcF [Azoarcus indigens]TDN44491.1 glycolate oxidase iron-sulfur subunit [Azoarcus indigens]
MQTQLADFIRDTPEGREADEILRKCVHCGFCTATCPTYQLLGDELDGPRGRIYLIKQLLEGQPVTAKTQLHLDRCLTCRSCETTCPSGVHYSRLADIGRELVERQVPRTAGNKVARWLLRELVPRTGVFTVAMKAGRLARGLLPEALKDKVPAARPAGPWPRPRHARRMLALAGCVQPAMAPTINAAAARVLDVLGISLVEADGAGCCGAVRFHLNDAVGARDNARRNIDAWWPLVERGEVEAIAMTASGCGVQVKDYGHLLQHDTLYAEKARRIAELTRDISEIVAAEAERLTPMLRAKPGTPPPVAWHAPCTLQHGLKLRGGVEQLLTAAGFHLTPVRDGHLCCGSAGTYSLLHPQLAGELRENKLAALTAGEPELIASANIGCITHLQAGTALKVRHWVELLDARLNGFPL